MDGNMNKLFEIAYNIESLNELAGRYVGYTKRTANELVYHAPENEDQLAKAKSVRKRPMIAFWAITVAFLLFSIYGVVSGSSMTFTVFIIICTLALAVMTIRLMSEKILVTDAKVVLKHFDRKIGSKKKTAYYVTAAIDYPEKVICTNILISKADYEKVDEGTPIMLVRALGSCYACVL